MSWTPRPSCSVLSMLQFMHKQSFPLMRNKLVTVDAAHGWEHTASSSIKVQLLLQVALLEAVDSTSKLALALGLQGQAGRDGVDSVQAWELDPSNKRQWLSCGCYRNQLWLFWH